METENVQRYGEVKHSKKTRDYTGFTKTGVYTRLLPVVKDLFVRFEKLESDSSLSFLWGELRVACLNSLTGIIVGFNQYHSRDKVRVYNSVKSNIGRMQGIIILLSELKKISVEEENRFCVDLEECIKASNALIKMMEAREK